MEFPSTWPTEAVDLIKRLQAGASNGTGHPPRPDISTARRITLQGGAGRLADVEVEKCFAKLYRSIHIWISSVERDPDIFHTTLQQNSLVVAELVVGHSSTATVTANGARSWVDWLGRQPTRIHAVLSFVIWDFLERNIFARRYPLGVSDETAAVFDDVIEVFKAERFARGERMTVPANKWRSETVLALTKTPAFRTRREEVLVRLSTELHEALARHFIGIDPVGLAEHLSDIDSLVVRPAAQLHQIMRCSRHEYVVRAPAVLPGEPLRKRARSEWALIGIGGWMPVGPGDEVFGVFACLYPAIVRKGLVDGEADVEVVKPVVLVYDKTAPSPPPRLRNYGGRGSGLVQPQKGNWV